jgi:protein SCO1/2
MSFRRLLRATAQLALAATASAAPVAAGAATKLHGVVLTIVGTTREVVVRHDAFDGMPAMTMRFRLSSAGDLARLHSGDTIDARVDERSDPMTLDAVRIAPKTASSMTAPLRSVHLLEIGETVPATPLVDQRGRAFSLADLRGRTAVVAFVYTRCRDARMCPLISAKFHALQQSFRGDPVHLVLVTLDPGYDTPAVLARYGKVFGADPLRWTLATGDPARVLDLDARFGVTSFADERVGLIHSERTVIVATDGRIAQTIDDATWSPAEIVAAVHAASDRSSNPIARFDLWLSSKAVAVCGNAVRGFSGLTDLLIVLAIFGAVGWTLYRIARRIFAESA